MVSEIVATGVAAATISDIAQKIAVIPHDFNINPKMVGQLARRAKMGEGTLPIDWAFAEAVAFGSLVIDGARVRLSGTGFPSAHSVSVMPCYMTPKLGRAGRRFRNCAPRGNRKRSLKCLTVPCRKKACSAFEYGYSVIATEALIIWEAQFGDFGKRRTDDHRSVHRRLRR
jgi:2-oxoglutarate dehydrogenase E1 component